MKLSEAILVGCKFREQGEECFISDAGKSCALGAAYEAIFGSDALLVKNGSEIMDELSHEFGSFLKMQCKHPGFTDRSVFMNIVGAIVDLNDTYGWTREKIAEWIASLEFPEVKTWTIEQTREVITQITNGVEQNETVTSD